MGAMLNDAWVRYEECQTAWLNELEFAEIARSLKAMARESGLPTDAVINELVHFGVDAAFALLAVESEKETVRSPNRPGSEWSPRPAGHQLAH